MGVKRLTKPTKDQPSRTTIARRRNARERRERVLAGGGRRIELLLEAPAAKELARLEQTTGDPAVAIITGLLLRDGNRRR